MKQIALSVIVLCIWAGIVTAAPVPLTLVQAADELGFGALQTQLTQVSNFTEAQNGLYFGTITSRVYTDTATNPPTVATFVWEIYNDAGSLSYIEDLSIAAGPIQNDLRITQIINGVNGYIAGTDMPDLAQATNNEFPIVDEIYYKWASPDHLEPGDTAILYVQVSGVTQAGLVDVGVQDFGGANATVVAPVDDPNSPDLTIPEPATTALLAVGFVGLLRRRR